MGGSRLGSWENFIAKLAVISYHRFCRYGNYMKQISVSSFAILILVLGAGVFAASSGIAGDIVLQKAPPLTIKQVPFYPENVARYHLGADVKTGSQSSATTTLQLSSNGMDRNTSVAALLCDDPSTGYQLPAGTSSIVISLSNIENVQSISFLNDGCEGDYTIALANADLPENSPAWRHLDKCALSEGAISAKVGPGEAKYVKLTFKVSRPGRIASFGVYATPALSDFTMPRPRKVSFEEASPTFALINLNYSDVHAKARGLYVSSGDPSQANNMIDGQPATSYKFASGDLSPTAVIDLGTERTLTRLSAIYARQSGRVDFYVLSALPSVESTTSEVRQVANSIPTTAQPQSIRISEEMLSVARTPEPPT